MLEVEEETWSFAHNQVRERLVAEIDEEISNTRAALDRASKLVSAEESTDVNPLRHALESDLARAELQEAGLNARRKSLTEALTMYRARLTQVEDASLGHDELQRQLKQAEENYVLYARKQEESRIADSLDQQFTGLSLRIRKGKHRCFNFGFAITAFKRD